MKRKLYILAGLLILIIACEKIPIGYINDNILYIKNPFNVDAGKTTYSPVPKLLGSTPPVKVELVEVRNKAGEIDTILAMPRDLYTWKDAYSPKRDTTLEQILNLRELTPNVPTMHVIEGSGQLMFTEATIDVPGGEYSLTLKMTNIAGTRIYKDAVSVIINQGNPYEFENQNHNIAATGDGWVEPGGKDQYDSRGVQITPAELSVIHDDKGPNKVHLIIRDKNGNPWSWKNNEMVKRGDRPCLEFALPWTEGVFNDVDLVYEYPFAPFPFGKIVTGAGDGIEWNRRYDYRLLADYVAIDGLTPNKWNVNMVFYFSFNVPGEWTFELQFPSLTRTLL